MRLLLGAALGAAGAAAWKYWQATRGPFEPTRFVWSRGFALMCDKNGGLDYVKHQGKTGPLAGLQAFDPSAYAGIRDGDLVWVRSMALPQFVDEVLPTVDARFGLVTGDEDWNLPAGFDRASAILDSPKVVRWFSQNYDGTDPRVTPMPIGLDFHTISNTRKWGHWPASPAAQERELETLLRELPPCRERKMRVHADFHFNRHRKQKLGEPREQVEAVLRENPLLDFQPNKVRRLDIWRKRGKYAFIVSPHGNGLDCHRTWESLVLGNIVIVKRSSLDPMFEGLPVVSVDDWREITPERLREWRDAHEEATASPDARRKLESRYWIERMRASVRAALD